MSAVMIHHRAQLLAPEETTVAARARDFMMRGDQNIVQDALRLSLREGPQRLQQAQAFS